MEVKKPWKGKQKQKQKEERNGVTLGGSDFMTYKISNWADHWLHY